MLLCLDFEKAFDSLDWKFITKVLKAFGFGEDICRWTATFYRKINSTVIVNGHTSSWFSIERGCRQGRSSLTLLVRIMRGNTSNNDKGKC